MSNTNKAPKLISYEAKGGALGQGTIEVEYARGRRVKFYRYFKIWADCEFGVTGSPATQRDLNALAKSGA